MTTNFAATRDILHTTSAEFRVRGIRADIFTMMPATDAFFMTGGHRLDFYSLGQYFICCIVCLAGIMNPGVRGDKHKA